MKKLKKGSIEAKRYMAKIRSMRKTKKRKVNETEYVNYKDKRYKDLMSKLDKKTNKVIGKKNVTYEPYQDVFKISIGDNSKIQKMYLDYVNNFLSIDKFAEHYGITKKQAISIINKGKKINETSIGDYKHNKSQFFEAKKPKNPRKKRTRKQNEWKVSRTKSGRFKKGGITKLNGISVTGTPPYKDENAVREIRLYADNNSQLYFSRKLPILKNLQKKYQKGTFDVNKASKLWRYYIDDAMQRYHKEFGSRGKWYNMLDTSDRQLLANEYAEETLSEFQLGNFVY